jgi:hypothetical protein
MKPINREFLVVSAHRANASAKVNADRTAALCEAVGKTPYASIRAEGVWKGETEPSLLIFDRGTLRTEAEAANVARYLGQECVLHVGADRSARLFYADGRVEPIGVWRRHRGPGVPNADGYTKVGGAYYVCTPT